MLKPPEKDIPQRLSLKWKDTFLGVVASIVTALLLLATNALLKGMELDIADAILVQSFSQIVIFLILLAAKKSPLWIWTVDEDKCIHRIRSSLIFGAALGTIIRVNDMLAVKFMPLGDAMTIILSQSIPTAILASIFLHERLRLIKISSVILVVAGVILIIRPPFIFPNDMTKDLESYFLGHNDTQSTKSAGSKDHGNNYYYVGAASAITVMITGAMFYINFKFLASNKSTSSGDLLLFYHGIGCLIVGLVLPFGYEGTQRIINRSDITVIYSSWQWLGLFGYAILLIALFIIRFEALKLVGPVIYGFVRSTEVILSYAAQIIIFGTFPCVTVIIGSCFILISCLAVLIEDNIVTYLPQRIQCIF